MKKKGRIKLKTLLLIILIIAVTFLVAGIWIGDSVKKMTYREAQEKRENEVRTNELSLDDFSHEILVYVHEKAQSVGFAVLEKDESGESDFYRVTEMMVDDKKNMMPIGNGEYSFDELLKADIKREVDTFKLMQVENYYLKHSVTGNIVGTKYSPSKTHSTVAKDFILISDRKKQALYFAHYLPETLSYGLGRVAYYKLDKVKDIIEKNNYGQKEIAEELGVQLQQEKENGVIDLTYDESLIPSKAKGGIKHG